MAVSLLPLASSSRASLYNPSSASWESALVPLVGAVLQATSKPESRTAARLARAMGKRRIGGMHGPLSPLLTEC